MSGSTKPGWERFGDAMVGWCGYLLLVPATVLGLLAGPKDLAWQATTLGIVALTAAWIYLMFTRLRPPWQEHRLRVGVFFIGVLALAAALMLRHPLFFIFMISGFFYASILRPLPLAFVGVFATSFLVNTLIAGFPQTDEGWTFYVVIIAIQTVVIGGGSSSARRSPSRTRSAARPSRDSRSRSRRTPVSTPSCWRRHARPGSWTSGNAWRARSTTPSRRA